MQNQIIRNITNSKFGNVPQQKMNKTSPQRPLEQVTSALDRTSTNFKMNAGAVQLGIEKQAPFEKPKSAVQSKRAHPFRQSLSPKGRSDISFEAKMRELHSAKDVTTITRLNPKVIETWINETLLDAEHLDIPGVVLKPEHKNPISRYNIDRLSLTNAGIPNEYVDRIYRGLFVYSIGFYEMLQRCLHHADNKYTLLSSLWKVFAILLEYCCKSNYQMLIAKLSKEHRDEIERLESNFTEHITKLTEQERSLKDSLENLQKLKDELAKQKEEETFLRTKIEEEFSKTVRNHEEEVQLRLKFESKLNNMHALHRDLHSKYQRALEDIYNLEGQNHTFSKLVSEQKAELIELRSEKVENESKITYQSERIKQLIQENEVKLRQLNDVEMKLSRAIAEIEQKNLALKMADQQVNEMRLKLDANRSIIDSLTSDKNHLELSLKENKDQKEHFKEKCDRLQQMHENAFQEMQDYKKQLVGIQEIKKDRDDRIDKLRGEFEILNKKYDFLDRDHASLKVHHQHITEEYTQLKQEFEQVSEKLRLSNKVRNEREEQLTEKSTQFLALEEVLKDRDYHLDKMRKELEKIQKRLSEVERQNDTLEVKKKSLDKQSEIQRKQLLDKIQNLNELVSAEKDTREMWINRFEKEQKTHIVTTGELLSAKAALQDAQLKIKNLEILLESVQKTRDQLKDQNEELLAQLTELVSRSEQLERDLYTKTELLKIVEAQHQQYAVQLRDEMQKMNERIEHERYCKDIEYEDLRSYTRKLYEQKEVLRRQNDSLNEQIRISNQMKGKVENELKHVQNNYNEVSSKYQVQSEQLKKEMEKASELDFQVQQYSRQIDDMHEEIESLSKQLDELQGFKEMNQGLQEKVRQLEQALETGYGVEQLLPQKKIGGDVQLMNRGIQTKKVKQKERNIQTDGNYQGNALFSTTQVSTNKISMTTNRKPRIASAAQTTSTIGMSGPNLMRDPSQGMSSTIVNSQGDLYLQEAMMLGSGSNLLDYDRVIRSAAHKYRHLVPTSEAIIEEAAENVTRVGGMFKRNQNIEDEDKPQPLRKTATDYIYESNGGLSKSQNPPRIFSGQSQPTTALQKHQQASRQRLMALNMDTGTDSIIIRRQPSNQSSRRSFKDEHGQETLKSVYEKRVTTAGIQQRGGTTFGSLQTMMQRPTTQPGQQRISSMIRPSMSATSSALQHVETVFSPSEESQKLRAHENIMYQQNLLSHTSNQRLPTTSKSHDRFVKGRPSIKTLIKVATAREGN